MSGAQQSSQHPVTAPSAAEIIAEFAAATTFEEMMAIRFPDEVVAAEVPPNAGLSKFEQIHQGYVRDHMIFWHPRVMVVEAKGQATHGDRLGAHVLVVPAERRRLRVGDAPNVDHIPAAQARDLEIVNRATAFWLAAVYPDAEYIGEVVAGKGIPHAHIHRAPVIGRDLFANLGSQATETTLVDMTDDDWIRVKDRVRFPTAYTSLLCGILDVAPNLSLDGLDTAYMQLEDTAFELAEGLGLRPSSPKGRHGR